MKTLEEFKNAGELAVEQDPEIKEFIYCYKDVALNRFARLFEEERTPEAMVDGLKAAILKGKGKEFVGLQFCFVGTFDMKTGFIEKFDEPKVLVDCNSLIEKVGDGNVKVIN